jgi:hypothetical protein
MRMSAPLTPSRICSIAVIALLFCRPSKDLGVASVPNVLPMPNAPRSSTPKTGRAVLVPSKPEPEGRHVSIHLRSGVMSASVRWTVDPDTSSAVLRGRIQYRPDAGQRASCSSIRFIQIARTTQHGGANYDWQEYEKPRNLIRTSSDGAAGIDGGYFVDHEPFACTPSASCSPYFRDYWPNADESRDGYQLSSDSAPASLVDYPFGWDILEQISLESCARCTQTGEFLGCASWGARLPAQGQREISPILIREAPSKTFHAALDKFDEFYTFSKLAQNASSLH